MSEAIDPEVQRHNTILAWTMIGVGVLGAFIMWLVLA